METSCILLGRLDYRSARAPAPRGRMRLGTDIPFPPLMNIIRSLGPMPLQVANAASDQPVPCAQAGRAQRPLEPRLGGLAVLLISDHVR